MVEFRFTNGSHRGLTKQNQKIYGNRGIWVKSLDFFSCDPASDNDVDLWCQHFYTFLR